MDLQEKLNEIKAQIIGFQEDLDVAKDKLKEFKKREKECLKLIEKAKALDQK